MIAPRTARRLALCLIALLGARPAGAKETIKIATLAPQGSVWDLTLREMAASWTKASAGAVELRVYPGGVAGDESDVVRKMRLGQFQGAALTVTGLAEIEPAFGLFFAPMLFADWSEVERVLAEVGPDLDARLAAKGYRRLFWAHGGWVHLFSRQPVRGLDDLKRQKLFVWAGDAALVDRWRRFGFQPVALAATDVTMGFQTKMIDVVPSPPIAALSLQWFRQAPYMQGLGLAPLIGAVVVREEAWRAAEPALGEAGTTALRAAEARLAVEIPKQEAAAIEEMRSRGLTVVAVDPPVAAEWRHNADLFARDGAEHSQVPPELLERTRKVLAALRGEAP